MTKSSKTAETDAEQDAASETKETATAPEDETSETSEAGETGETGETGDPDDQAAAATDEGTDAADEGAEDEPVETAKGAGWTVATGAGAVVSAGLGIASLTGTWLSDQMSSRQQLIGQINTGQAVEPSEQIAAIYGSPAHTTALFNGFFAVAAMIVAGATLLLPVLTKNRDKSPVWVRAVAYAGLALGAVGLVIAAVMWFDVFTDLPQVPEPQPLPGA